MIRLLHVLGGLSSVGGTPRKLLYLAKHSDPTRLKHSVLCFDAGDMGEAFAALGVSVRAIGSSNPLKIVRAIEASLGAESIDAIATHFTRQFICGNWVAGLRNMPLIHHEHGPAVGELLGNSLVAKAGRVLKRRWLPHAKVIVCNSRYTARTVQSTFGAASQLFAVIHNPVERRVATSRRTPKRLSERHVLTIGHIGGMIVGRDQATLIHALNILHQRGIAARLKLVGDGPLRRELEALSAELKLTHAIEFLGYRSDLEAFFNSVDVYVNPALVEGFGIAVVEAMLEGVPVVLANAAAHPELIVDGATGLLYEPGDANALASAILKIAHDATLYDAISTSAMRHAQDAFTPTRYAVAYQDLIEQVLRDSARR